MFKQISCLIFAVLIINIVSADNLCGQGQYGQYVIQNHSIKLICTPCDATCLDCNGPGPEACIKCKDGSYLTNNQCFDCIPNCVTCASGQDCSECANGYFYNDTQNQCQQIDCGAGHYYDQLSNQCQPCTAFCQQCTASSNCQECTAGYYYVQSNNTCNLIVCSPGQYYDLTVLQCEPCISNCLACTSSNNCQNCAAGYQFNQATSQCELIQCGPNNYFDYQLMQCKPCNYKLTGCSTCTETSTSNFQCTACQSGYNFFNGNCIQCTAQQVWDPKQNKCDSCTDASKYCEECTYDQKQGVCCTKCSKYNPKNCGCSLITTEDVSVALMDILD